MINLKRVENFLSHKQIALLFYILLIGVIIPTFCGLPSSNFWYRLYSIITDKFYNMLLLVAVMFGTIFLSKSSISSINISTRCCDYKEYILITVKNTIVLEFVLLISGLILSIAGAIVFCFNDFQSYSVNGISIIAYIVFIFVRQTIIMCAIGLIMYFLIRSYSKYITIPILFAVIIFFILPLPMPSVQHFYQMPLLFYYYLQNIDFNTLWLEILCSFLEIQFLLILDNLAYKFTIRRKKDII